VTFSFLFNIILGVDNECEILNVLRLQYMKLVFIYDTLHAPCGTVPSAHRSRSDVS
jgi:hypothetical protein